MRIDLNTQRGMGFGDLLCVLSVLHDSKQSIEIYCDNQYNQYKLLQEITTTLNIPKDRIDIIFNADHAGDFSGGCYLKLFNNYYYPDTVNLNGQQITVDDPNRVKPYVGLACYSGVGSPHDIFQSDPVPGKDRMPGCRYRPIGFWSQIFTQVKGFGYDILTLDQPTNLEFKISQLLNCSAVICYEGGIAHLCNMLRIPTIVLDWQWPNISAQFGDFQVEVLHQSATAYILKDDKKLLNMCKKEFESLVESLQQGHGNNRLFSGEYQMKFTDGFKSEINFVDRNENTVFTSLGAPRVSDSAAEFMNKIFKEKL